MHYIVRAQKSKQGQFKLAEHNVPPVTSKKKLNKMMQCARKIVHSDLTGICQNVVEFSIASVFGAVLGGNCVKESVREWVYSKGL